MSRENKKSDLAPRQANARPIRSGSVRVGPLQGIPDILSKHGRTPFEQILEEQGLQPELFDNPEKSISFEAGSQLLVRCEAETEIPHFGILLGSQSGLAALGQLAQLARYAPDVRTALRLLILHISVHDRGGAPILTVRKGITHFGYAIYEPIKTGHKIIYDLSLSIMCSILRELCGKNWLPLEVHFSHAHPDDVTAYEQHFRAPLRFNSDGDALAFDSKWLETPIATADAEKFDRINKQIEAFEAAMNIDLAEKARAIIRPLIVSQHCSLTNIANTLAVHPRTLNRRLKDHGTTLRQLIGEIRFEMAKQLMLDSDLSVTEISTVLGYSDSSVLTRSFQRWAGLSPTDWREINARDGS